MGTAIPQTMLFRLLTSLGLPAETTLPTVAVRSKLKKTSASALLVTPLSRNSGQSLKFSSQ